MKNSTDRFSDIEEVLIRHLRLYHYPVAIFFERDGKEQISAEKRPKNRLSFCQLLAHVRQVGGSLRLYPKFLGCATAADLFGFSREEEKSLKTLNKYVSRDASERFYADRPRFAPGTISSVALCTLGRCDKEPDGVIMVVDSLQAMHLLDFYAKAVDKPDIPLGHSVNGAACANTVKALKQGAPQLAFPCPGAFTSGKMERGEVVLSFPWEAFQATVQVVFQRAEKGKFSLLGGPQLVGDDVCRNCPLIRFHES